MAIGVREAQLGCEVGALRTISRIQSAVLVILTAHDNHRPRWYGTRAA